MQLLYKAIILIQSIIIAILLLQQCNRPSGIDCEQARKECFTAQSGTTDTVRDTVEIPIAYDPTPAPITRPPVPAPVPDTVYTDTTGPCSHAAEYTISQEDSLAIFRARLWLHGRLDSSQITYQLKPQTIQVPVELQTITHTVHHHSTVRGIYAYGKAHAMQPISISAGLLYMKPRGGVGGGYNFSTRSIEVQLMYRLVRIKN